MLTETRPAAARAVDLRKVFGEGAAAVEALRGVSVDSQPASTPRSWAHRARASPRCCTAWRAWTSRPSGSVWIGDKDLTHLKDRDLTEIRRDRVGFVFQAFNLVPTLTAAENITLPSDIAGGTSTGRGSTRSSTRSGSAIA